MKSAEKEKVSNSTVFFIRKFLVTGFSSARCEMLNELEITFHPTLFTFFYSASRTAERGAALACSFEVKVSPFYAISEQ